MSFHIGCSFQKCGATRFFVFDHGLLSLGLVVVGERLISFILLLGDAKRRFMALELSRNPRNPFESRSDFFEGVD